MAFKEVAKGMKGNPNSRKIRLIINAHILMLLEKQINTKLLTNQELQSLATCQQLISNISVVDEEIVDKESTEDLKKFLKDQKEFF